MSFQGQLSLLDTDNEEWDKAAVHIILTNGKEESNYDV